MLSHSFLAPKSFGAETFGKPTARAHTQIIIIDMIIISNTWLCRLCGLSWLRRPQQSNEHRVLPLVAQKITNVGCSLLLILCGVNVLKIKNKII